MHNTIKDIVPAVMTTIASFTVISLTGCDMNTSDDISTVQTKSSSVISSDADTSVVTEQETIYELRTESEMETFDIIPPFYEEKDGNIVVTFNENGFDIEYIYVFDETKSWTALDVKLIPGKISSLEEMCWESAFPLDASEFTEENGYYIAHSGLFTISVDDRTMDGAIDNAESRIAEYKLLNEWKNNRFDASGSSGFSGLGNNNDVEKGEYKVEASIVPSFSYDISAPSDSSEIRILVKTRKNYISDSSSVAEKDIELTMSANGEDIGLTPDDTNIFVRDNEIIIWAYSYSLKPDETFDQIAVSVDTETGPEVTVFSYYELFE